MARGFRFGGAGGAAPEPEIKALIPTMTSNTAPSGVCFSNGEYNATYASWKSFDHTTNYWLSPYNVLNAFIGYSFATPVVVKSVVYTNLSNGQSVDEEFKVKLQASNDQQTWIDLSEELTFIGNTNSGTINLARNKTAYTSYRLYKTYGAKCLALQELQLHGYDPSLTPAKFPVLYDRGSWGIGWESKGDYTYTESGWSAADMIINSDNIAVNTAAGSSKLCIIGTTSKVDLTNYTMMKCICRNINNYGGGNMSVQSGKNRYTQNIRNTFMNATDTPTEFAMDISDLSGEYYLSLNSESGRASYYYKWWLE